MVVDLCMAIFDGKSTTLIFDIQPARGKQPIRKAFDHVKHLEIQFRLKRISSGRKIISEHVFMCTA